VQDSSHCSYFKTFLFPRVCYKVYPNKPIVVFIVDHVRRDWGQLVPNRGNKLKVWNVDNRKQFKKSGDVDYAKDGEN
jgi:hypothetical protein